MPIYPYSEPVIFLFKYHSFFCSVIVGLTYQYYVIYALRTREINVCYFIFNFFVDPHRFDANPDPDQHQKTLVDNLFSCFRRGRRCRRRWRRWKRSTGSTTSWSIPWPRTSWRRSGRSRTTWRPRWVGSLLRVQVSAAKQLFAQICCCLFQCCIGFSADLDPDFYLNADPPSQKLDFEWKIPYALCR